MEIPSWLIYVAGELLVLLLGVIVFLFYRLKNKEDTWTEQLIVAKHRIHKLKKLEPRYQQVKENLHQYVHMIKKLKEQLEHEKNNPALLSQLTDLEEQFKEIENELLQLHQELDESKPELVNVDQQQIDELHAKIIILEQKNQHLQSAIESANDQNSQFQNNLKDVGLDLWGKAPDNIAPAPQAPQDLKSTFEFGQNTEKNKKEVERLRIINKDQRSIIYDLRLKMAAEGNKGSSDDDALNQLEKMLSESETIVTMLEDELATVQLKIKKLEAAEASRQNIEDMVTKAAGGGSDDEMKQLENQLKTANQMAMTMMEANGDQSNVIGFARNSINLNNLKDLGEAVLITVKSYSLKGSIQVRGTGSTVNLGTDSHVSPADIAHLSDVSNTERYEENGSELLIRFTKVSLLINNMPENSPDLLARYRDTLAIVCELACSNANIIEANQVKEQQQVVLKKVISTTHRTIKDVELQFAEQAEQSKEIVSSMSSILDSDAFVNAMDPIYRDIYRNIMVETKERFDVLHLENSTVDKTFSKIIDNLQSKIT